MEPKNPTSTSISQASSEAEAIGKERKGRKEKHDHWKKVMSDVRSAFDSMILPHKGWHPGGVRQN